MQGGWAMIFTLFPDLSAREKQEHSTTTDGMVQWLRDLPTYMTKRACPLISLNRFGDVLTDKGSLRHDPNIMACTGAIGDYDAGSVPPADAAAVLDMMGIESIIVTTPSHGIKGNRWRLLLPFSEPQSLERRYTLLAQVNTLLGGILAGESFTASQSFYVGQVAGVEYQVIRTHGQRVDVVDLTDVPLTGRPMAQPRTQAAAGGPMALAHKRASGGIEQVIATLEQIPNDEPDWERWNKVGMAIYNATGGSPEGLEVWRDWSARCKSVGRDTDSVDARWRHYADSPPTEVGMGTLVHMAGGARTEVPDPVQPVSRVDEPQIMTDFQFLAASQQIEHFKGCVYVQDIHRVFTPRGSLLKPEQFRAAYGGYVFALDAQNDKTTKSAWEAFTESQAVRYPTAEGMTFRPEYPPGALIEEEGRHLVNTYIPIKVDRREGDVGPFLHHLRLVLPDERDAAIMLAYMAACVQHIGVKFQWWPLLQGMEGNGKTLFTRCVAHAVGLQYSHFPRADEVSNKFNSWVRGKLFIGIEDVYYPDHKREIIESLKPIITNEWQVVEPKGVDQVLVRVCANGILNTNHKGAIPKTRRDRRYCMFHTAQQDPGDIEEAGMQGDYFPQLYRWLRSGGYAYVAHYLATYEIPDDLNPAGACHRAPVTSSTDAAIADSRGAVEQAIVEAIEEGRPGFAGGWVSSMALDRLIEHMRMNRAVPLNKRRDVMRELGYDWHPALKDGRVNNAIMLDGGKPRLFIRLGHPDASIEQPAQVARAYQDAQQGVE